MENVRLWVATVVLLASGTNLFGSVVGQTAADFALPDQLGHEHSLAEMSDSKLVVVVFLGTECPLAKLYSVRLQALADEYAERGLAVVAIDSNAQDSLTDITHFVRQHELKYPVLVDRGHAVADQFGAERTPQVFLLDHQRVVRYQGRVDDQYLVGVVRNAPEKEDLRLAIDELLAGKEVSRPETDPQGCLIGRTREPVADSEVNFTRDVAPILQSRCVECHREGEIGPFELTSYDEAAGWGEMMVEVIREQRMPPWHANPEHGEFANDRSMSREEKEIIYKWVENGCPQGDPADLPKPREYTAGWQMPREPDLVLSMPKPFEVPATAGRKGVPYQYISVPSGFQEDKWIDAAEVQPGNRKVLHHTIVYAQPSGGRWRRDWIFVTAYVPGLRYDAYPEGAAKRIPAESTFIFEQHYTPIGSKQTDVTSVGLVFSDVEKITHEIVTTEVGNVRFEIPPREAAHVVTATSQPAGKNVTLLSLSPHMHLRGKAFRYELVKTNGDRETLLDVPAYDFNWQTRYLLAESRKMPPGAVLHCRAVFDNSKENLANPDPGATVTWGDQSWDEMMLGYFDVMIPRDDDERAGRKPMTTGLDVVGMFDAADADRSKGFGQIRGCRLRPAGAALRQN